MLDDPETVELMLKKPFAFYGSPIPAYVQAEIGKRMAEDIPPELRPQTPHSGQEAAMALSGQRAEERARLAPAVARMLARGMSVQRIAKEIGRSEGYVRRIRKELQESCDA